MGRPKRVAAGGMVYHVLNRANRRATMFHKAEDYDAFLRILAEGIERISSRLLGLCLMPNHWHLVLWPHNDGELSRLVGWVTNTHVKRHHEHYHDKIGGHLYQGRFRSFPIQEDGHLLTVLRYVEANPLRCGLAGHAGDWPWSSCSLRNRRTADTPPLSPWPIAFPANWESLVEQRWAKEELAPMQAHVDRGSPFGDPSWVQRTATRLGLLGTLRNRGRQPKIAIT
jgi:putative transposase